MDCRTAVSLDAAVSGDCPWTAVKPSDYASVENRKHDNALGINATKNSARKLRYIGTPCVIVDKARHFTDPFDRILRAIYRCKKFLHQSSALVV